MHESLLSQPFTSQLLGARASRVAPGEVDIERLMQDDFRQPQGHAYGILLSALADSAAGEAAQTPLAAEFDVVTVEYEINYLAPAFGERPLARGWVITAGRTLQVCAADLFACSVESQTHVAHMATTMMAVAAHRSQRATGARVAGQVAPDQSAATRFGAIFTSEAGLSSAAVGASAT